MSQGLEKQLENVLLELTKDSENSRLTDLNALIQKLQTYQGVLEKQNDALQQKNIKLKTFRNYYHDLYHAIPNALFALDNQGFILDVNFAGTELFGIEKNELINTDLARQVAPDFMDAFFYHRKWTLESDTKQMCELKLVKGDCSTFFARLDSISLTLNDGHQKQIQTIITDISDEKQMEGALELAKTRAADAGKIKAEFLSKMSHEFRPKAITRGMSLLDDIDGAPQTLRADARMLTQIIHHLLSNAIKFTNDGGEVLLSARIVDCIVRCGRRCGDATDLKIFQECIETRDITRGQPSKCVEVSVADTGVGLNAEDQNHIFEAFKQVDESLSRKHQGAGIGLSLAKSLVELQGGKIWVDSEGENKGSTFRFILPI